MRNPENFPEHDASFFLQGPVGPLEVKAASPKTPAYPVTVIGCHPHPLHGGTMENKVVTTLFRGFLSMGARVVRFNYRGVGQSAGQYAKAIGETEDLLAVIAWVKSVRPADQIWLTGFSFGAYVAARAAARENICQLLTIAPAVNHMDYASLEKPACPWLVIQGDADEVVPPAEVYHWIARQDQAPTLIKLENAGHFFHGRLLDLREILENHYRPILASLKG